MALVLPSTVQELNSLQNSLQLTATSNMYVKPSNQAFENIAVEKKFKREVSLPNGVENWNISNFESYLNFEDNVIPDSFEVIQSADDRLVPEEGYQRGRCESFSSVSSSMDDKHLVYKNLGVKTFSTVRMDSGSTCFSSDSYIHSNTPTLKGLDVEETYQNLDMFLQQVPELTVTDTMSSSLSSVPSPDQENKFELSVLHESFGLQAGSSQDSFDGSLKRPADISSEDESLLFGSSKRLCETPPGEVQYYEHRRKNNIASKNCRKTRKEKQKEMEARVSDLEKEKEGLKVEIQVLEDLIQAHKMKLYAILQKR